MQMQARAFGAKWGGRGASGLAAPAGPGSAASRPSSRSKDARATRPTPLAAEVRKSRRDWWIASWIGCMARSVGRLFPRDELVEVQDRPRQRHPGTGLGPLYAGGLPRPGQLRGRLGGGSALAQQGLVQPAEFGRLRRGRPPRQAEPEGVGD